MERHGNCMRGDIVDCPDRDAAVCLTCGWYVAEHRRRIEGGLVYDTDTGKWHYLATAKPRPPEEPAAPTSEHRKEQKREYMVLYRARKKAERMGDEERPTVRIIGADAED